MASSLSPGRAAFWFIMALPLIMAFRSPFFPGKMLPDDPEVWEGGTLVLTCSVPSDSKWNSSYMFFTINRRDIDQHQPVDENYTSVINSSAIRLTLPNVGREYDKQFVYCRGEDNSREPILSIQTITVKFHPEPVEIIECVVHLGAMNCSWEPHHKNQTRVMQHVVTDTLQWRIVGEPGAKWKSCHQSEDAAGYCIITKELFQVDAIYDVRVNVSTHFSYNISDVTRVNSRDVVKLPVITNINIAELNSTRVALDWPSPLPSRTDIKYNIIFRQSTKVEGGNITNKSFWVDRIRQVVLTDLVPYREYIVTIQSITLKGGFLSDFKQMTFTTLSDVPLRNPDVTIGSFFVKNIDDSICRDITLFWRHVLKIEEHGPGFRYDYNLNLSDSTTWDSSPCNSRHKSKDKVTVTVPRDSSLTINILSHNNQGFPHVPPTDVTIPANQQLIEGPENFTVIALSKSSVRLSWNNDTSENETTSGYHIYWCIDGGPDICHDELSWQAIPPDTHSFTLNNLPKEYDQYQFAISREVGIMSSGLVLSGCTYDMNTTSPSPDWRSEKLINDEHGELGIQWDKPLCHSHRGFIYSYLLSYCATEGDVCPEDPEVTQHMKVPVTPTSFTLTGLQTSKRYCVTIRSLTAKGPTPHPSKAMCGTVTGTWMSSGVMSGFIIGGIVLLIVLSFCLFKFGKYCFRIYHKFKTGVHVEMPHASYSAQNSVSSQRGLVDDENYFLNDFAVLAKQNSQESTADSGRGSLSQDHIRMNLHRVSSGELDDVFPTQNGVGVSYPSSGRPVSEPVSSYARIAHASGGSANSKSIQPKCSSLPRPKLPARNLSPHTSPLPGHSARSVQAYSPQQDSQTSNQSMPCYVKVGDVSKGSDGQTSPERSDHQASGLTSAPLSDYVKAQNKSGDYDFHADHLGQLGNGPTGYITAPEGMAQADPAYITVPDNVNRNNGYITVPENVKHNAGYITVPDSFKSPSTNNVSDNVNPGSGYITLPETANPQPGYVTSPPLGQTGGEPVNNAGYVLAPPPTAKQGKTDYVPHSSAMQPGSMTMPGHIGPPANMGYVPHPTETGGYVTTPQQNQPPPHHRGENQQSRPSPEPSSGPQGNTGYVTLPTVSGQCNETVPRAATGPTSNTPAFGAPNQSGYITMPAPLQSPTDGALGEAGDSGYIKAPSGGMTPPLGVSTPRPRSGVDPRSNPYIPLPGSQPRGSQPMDITSPQSDTGYITLPGKTSSVQDQAYIPIATNKAKAAYKTDNPQVMANDANHNNVNPYIAHTLVGAGGENENETDHPMEGHGEEDEETHSLLPSDGGRKVLNKSGYVVIST